MESLPVTRSDGLATLPKHIAIVMDGNGRWAKLRNLPRMAGHKAGVETARKIIRACGEKGVEVLTLFAFSSENWRRPQGEVGLLMDLFMNALQNQIDELHKHNVRLQIIGAREAFAAKLQVQMAAAEQLTRANTGLKLNIAANYGGRWDITQAAQRLAAKVEAGEITAAQINSDSMTNELSLSGLPEPDLFIRTGGEQRISNFLLWQLAYTELYFTDTLWPDFDNKALDLALDSFAKRQRRFGYTGEQIEQITGQAKGA
ncbi:MAG TPA: isoprenyl transferase [Gammaproteobacteria bacterium]|nr:isoprenyl transferase [Gammaproteobacteria bacterium]